MSEIGERTKVSVTGIAKIKTIMQIVALTVLLYQHDFEEFRLYYVGETLLVAAAAMTIWSASIYLRAAWPAMRGERAGAGISGVSQAAVQADPEAPKP